MSEVDQFHREVVRWPIRGRVAFAVAIGELSVGAITPDEAGHRIARDALGMCWKWISGAKVAADELAEFVDGPPERDLGGRELDWPEGVVQSGLIALATAVSYAAYRAYELEKNRARPAPVAETSEKSLMEIISRGLEANESVAPALRKVIGNIQRLCGGSDARELGPHLTRSQVLEGVAGAENW